MKSRDVAILTLLLFAGACAGLYRLTDESLFIDEAHSIFTARLPRAQAAPYELAMGHLPGYYMLLRMWLRSLPDNLFTQRVLSFIFFIPSAILIYILCMTVFDDRITAFSACALFLFSPVNIHYAREVRPYSLNVFLVLLSYIFLTHFLQGGRVKNIVYYTICLFLLASTHLFNSFVLAAQLVFVIFYYLLYVKKLDNRRAAAYAVSFFLSSAVFLIAALAIKTSMDIRAAKIGLGFDSLSNYITMFMNFFSYRNFTELPLYTDLSTSALHASKYVLLFMLFALGIRSSFRKKPLAFFLTYSWYWVPLIILLLTSYISSSFHFSTPLAILRNRHIISTTIPLYMLSALAISELIKKKHAALILVVLILLFAWDLGNYHSTQKNSDWNSAFDFLHSEIAEDEELVYISGHYRPKHPVEYFIHHYYSRVPFRRLRPDIDKQHLQNENLSGVWLFNWKPLSPVSDYVRNKYIGKGFLVENFYKKDQIMLYHFRKERTPHE